MRHATDRLYDPDALNDPQIVAILGSISSDVRLAILAELLAGPCCVQTLADKLGMKRPRVSKHLALLRQSGILVGRKNKKETIYRLSRSVAIGHDHESLTMTITPRTGRILTLRVAEPRDSGRAPLGRESDIGAAPSHNGHDDQHDRLHGRGLTSVGEP